MFKPSARDRQKSRLARLWITSLLIAAAAFMATAAKRNEVLIAAEDDWPPYSYVNAGQTQVGGHAVDLVREALATEGIEVRFVGVPFARCMQMAKTGQAAGCFNATIVDDNRDNYVWHATPMFREELAIFSLSGRTEQALTLRDLEGRKVGYTIGYTYPVDFRFNPNIQRFSAKSDQVLLEMLLARRVDYILVNTGPAYHRIAAMGLKAERFSKVGVLSVDGFWVAFSPARSDSGALAEKFEKGLENLRKSGRMTEMETALRARLKIPTGAK